MALTDLMTANPAYCNPTTPLQDVALMMIDCDCGMIPIVAEGGSNKAIGTITDRDIVIRTLAEGYNPMELHAEDAMSDNPVSIHMDADHRDAMEMMEDNQIRRLIVVDDNNNLCGILSQADLARGMSGEEVGEVVQHVSKPGEGEESAARR